MSTELYSEFGRYAMGGGVSHSSSYNAVRNFNFDMHQRPAFSLEEHPEELFDSIGENN